MIESDPPVVTYKLLDNANYHPKLCKYSNGIDIPLQKSLHLKPKEIKKVGLMIRFQIPKGHCALLLNKSSALTKYFVKITLGLIDQGFNNELKMVVENTKDKNLNIKPGIAICQLLIIPSNVPTISKHWIEPAKTRGEFGSTGQKFVKRTSNESIKVKLKNISEENKLESNDPLNLMQLAKHSHLSATAFMLTGAQSISCLSINFPYFKEGANKKIYLDLFINNKKMVSCADSGSDLTLMQESMYKRVINKYPLHNTPVITIKSYTDTDITVLGQTKVMVKFTRFTSPAPIVITVIKDVHGSITPFLFGNDSFKSCLVTLSYLGNVESPTPEFIINHPFKVTPKIYYVSPAETVTCEGNFTLEPFETAKVTMKLHPAAPVTDTDQILISSQQWDNVQIIPSKSDLQYDATFNTLIAKACAINLTKQRISGTIKADFEIVTQKYYEYPIHAHSKNKILKIMKNKPPVRQILSETSTNEIKIERITVCNISIEDVNQNESILVNDKPTPSEDSNNDMNDILGGTKVSYSGTAEIADTIMDTGLEAPTIVYDSPEEAIRLDRFEPEIRNFIDQIFLKKYRNVVSLHNLDAGDVSKTLGYTTLRLIPGEKLPRHRRIYHLSPQDTRYLEELLEQFIRFDYVRRAPIDSTDKHLFGMSTYLVPRRKPTDMARLVIDFSPLTSIIQSPPSIVPDISASLQNLQGKALFSSMDLRYAYLALKIDEESKSLTTFLTATGAYQWLSIPTGAACSPAYFIDCVNRILHYKPVLDEFGNPIYETPHKVKLERDVLRNSFHYFDDIISSSEIRNTYHETLQHHFDGVEKIIERLSFHNVKISVGKSEFAKSKILFLGWIISHDFIIPDPRRMEKIKEAKFPSTKKELRSFLGLVNSIRRVIPFEVIKQMQILTPLTSSSRKVNFEIKPEHETAFLTIKEKLLTEPLFCNLIREDAVKYLWVDAASSSGSLGAVLAQRIDNCKDPKILPTSIDLEDPVHRIIFDQELHYEPCKLYTSLPIIPQKGLGQKTIPPKIKNLGKLRGFTENNVNDSLFWSMFSIYAIYGCKIPDSIKEIRLQVTKEIKKGILGIKLKDQSFNNNHAAYRQFLYEFENGLHSMDKDWLIAEALAKITHRCLIFLSTLPEHTNKNILKFNPESAKPPLIFGVYREDNKIVFTPFFHNKNLEFNIKNLKNQVQIIAYLAKSVPEGFRSRPILDLEAFAILTALHSLQRYISNVRCHLLTDSRVLYYLFHQKVGDSSTKIRRWVLKLISDYPMITLHFIRTTENLADYLTRQGLPKGDLKKLSLLDTDVQDFYDRLPKNDFTLEEWAEFCQNNPQYLSINYPTVNSMNYAIKRGIENIKDIVSPINILKGRLSRENIINAQKLEMSEIYEKCLKSESYKYTKTKNNQKYEYSVETDLLTINQNGNKILIPDSLIGPLLAYMHLLGHMGTDKMVKNISINYYFPNMYSLCRQLCQSCYSCFLTYGSSRKNELGKYPTPEYPFQEISVDIAESLNAIKGYRHLLIVQDVLSDYLMIFPLKTKTATEVNRIFMYSVFQHFNIAKVHSDNATCFRNRQLLELWASINIEVINSSAQNPPSRGKAEKAVGTVKTLLKKLLATASSQTLNWEALPFMISKIYNHTVTPRTGFKPIEMIMGSGKTSKAFFEQNDITPIHHTIHNNKTIVEKLTEEVNRLSEIAHKNLDKLKNNRISIENKNRIRKKFKRGDIVYVLDRYIVPGNPRPLKTKYYPSPCTVLHSYHTTTLIKRIADGFQALYSNNDIKKFHKTSPIMALLPQEVQNVLLHDFKSLLEEDLITIIKYDHLNIPRAATFSDSVKKNLSSHPPLQGEGHRTEPTPSNDQQKTQPTNQEEEETNPEDIEDEEEENEEGTPQNSLTSHNMKLRPRKTVHFK